MTTINTTDATFEADVLDRSTQVPVIVDLWAEWCGPCRALSPVLEKVVAEANGNVVLAKVDVDANPGVSAAFQVQSIPSVYAIKDRKVVDGFMGALPEPQVREFVARLAPGESEADRLAASGDEAALRQALEADPGHEGAILGLARLLVERGEPDEALALLARIPESAETRRLAAQARIGVDGAAEVDDDVTQRLDDLLERVRDDDVARQEFVDLLEVLGPDDPRTPRYRRALTAKLF